MNKTNVAEKNKATSLALFTKAALGAALIVLVSCTTKKREEQFVQGQGSNLNAIGDYHGKVFDIQTGAPIGRANATFSSEVTYSGKKVKLESFPLVNYTTNATLLKDAPLKGIPNHKYKAFYKINNDFKLSVYKIGDPDDIGFDESTFAEKLPEFPGKLAIEILNYRVQLIKVETVKNSDNDEKLNLKTEIGVSSLSEAQYFKIDYPSRQLTEVVAKVDVFPADYFVGDSLSNSKGEGIPTWYYSETKVSSTDETTRQTGGSFAMDIDGESAQIVQFRPAPQGLSIVNVNYDDRSTRLEESQTPVTFVQGEWLDFKKPSSVAGNNEEIDKNSYWKKLKFIKLDFASSFNTVYTNLVASADGARDRSGRVQPGRSQLATTVQLKRRIVDVVISDDWFSVTLELANGGEKVRYGFLRVKPSEYKSKTYRIADAKIFGYFASAKNVKVDKDLRRESDIEDFLFVNRFQPVVNPTTQQKEIIYYLSRESSPSWVTEIAEIAVAAWDEAFAKAGTGIRVVLNKNFRPGLGDTRYNILHFVESLQPDGGWGYGPGINNPLSGEIISATTNIFLSGAMKEIDAQLDLYVRSQLNESRGQSLPNVNKILGFDSGSAASYLIEETPKADLAAPANKAYGVLAPVFAEFNGEKAWKQYLSHWKDFIANGTDKSIFKTETYREEMFALRYRNLPSKVDELCPQISRYISRVIASPALRSDTKIQNEAYGPCIVALSKKPLVWLTTHEMGHNFGLRHNFMASADRNNFPDPQKDENGNLIRIDQTASVMDYLNLDDMVDGRPGKYDVAAIRFGYSNQIELKDGSFFTLSNPNATIANNLELAGKKITDMKSYFYCTDEDVQAGLYALCNRFDKGTTRQELVENTISEYNTDYLRHQFRYDSHSFSDLNQLFGEKAAHLRMLFRVYEDWRSLVAKFVGKESQSLSDMTIPVYANIKSEIKKHPQFKEEFADLEPAKKKIFSFITGLALAPAQTCFLWIELPDGNRSILIEDLQKIREFGIRRFNENPSTCFDKIVPQIIYALNSLGADQHFRAVQLAQGGYQLGSFKKDFTEQGVSKPFDEVGIEFDKELAATVLLTRTTFSKRNFLNNNNFSFLDEPDLRDDWQTTILDRSLNGVRKDFYGDSFTFAAEYVRKPNEVLSAQDQLDELRTSLLGPKNGAMPSHIKSFEHEGLFLKRLFFNSFSAMVVPGDVRATLDRLQVYNSMVGLPGPAERELFKIQVPLTQTLFFMTNAESSSATSLAQAIYNSNERRKMAEIAEALAPIDKKVVIEFLTAMANSMPSENVTELSVHDAQEVLKKADEALKTWVNGYVEKIVKAATEAGDPIEKIEADLEMFKRRVGSIVGVLPINEVRAINGKLSSLMAIPQGINGDAAKEFQKKLEEAAKKTDILAEIRAEDAKAIKMREEGPLQAASTRLSWIFFKERFVVESKRSFEFFESARELNEKNKSEVRAQDDLLFSLAHIFSLTGGG